LIPSITTPPHQRHAQEQTRGFFPLMKPGNRIASGKMLSTLTASAQCLTAPEVKAAFGHKPSSLVKDPGSLEGRPSGAISATAASQHPA